MIFGNIELLETARKEYPNVIADVLEFLQSVAFDSVEDGVLPYQSDSVVIKVFHGTTEDESKRTLERHKKYIDLHYVIEGRETIIFCALDRNVKVKEELPKDDLYLLENSDREMKLHLEPGDFSICFPWDLHKPLVKTNESETIRKLVAKIPADSL
ncbi:YhcH/YjgK/YiaL family protein [Paenibacillus sp. TH7-28]